MTSCERACRTLEDACARTDLADPLLADCWYVAGAAARLLARFADYDPTQVAMQIAICQHVAARVSVAHAPSLHAAAHACASACARALAQIWDRAIDPAASWDERNAPVELVPETARSFEDDDAEVATDQRGPSQSLSRRATLARIAPIRVRAIEP